MSKLLALLLALFLAACQQPATEEATKESTEPKMEEVQEETSEDKASEEEADSEADADAEQLSAKVTLEVDGEEIAEENVHFEEGDSAMDVLKANFTVEEKDGMVTSIDRHEQDDKANKYWMYEVNGEMAEVGAADYELKDGDQVLWKLEAM